MPQSGTPKHISSIVSRKRNPDDRDKNIAWLNEKWEGPGWIPADVRAASKKAKVPLGVLRGLKAISELAMKRNIRLASLWEPGGCLRNEVLVGATIKNGPKSRNKPPKPWPLSRDRLLLAYQFLTSFPAEVGDDSIASPGSKIGVDSEEEAPKDEQVVMKLSSPSPNPQTEQRESCLLPDAIASTEHELHDQLRGTKRPMKDNDAELLNPPTTKSQRVSLAVRLRSTTELDTAIVAKRKAEKALLNLLYRKDQATVSQAERVQARLRKLKAEEAFHQAYARLHRPSRDEEYPRDH
ncbi:hypothetical protein F52700_4734 [Fusarium sp. NRRL 52700]|nr:hypothetical protein F52700_4734 [Fusarium sp. NRRL 52700]